MLIFIPAILLGLGAAIIKSRFAPQRFLIPVWKSGWLVPAAFLFMLVVTRPQIFQLTTLDQSWAIAFLSISQLFLLLFVFLNLRISGLWILGLGFLLNMACMQANGGLMPVQPERIPYILNNPDVTTETYLGLRFGDSKDIVIDQQETKLWFLSDRFPLPEKFPYRVVFSLGDVVIGFGLFFTLVGLSPGKFIDPVGAPYEYPLSKTRSIGTKEQTSERYSL
jgi:hypothetical protein